MPNLIQRFLHKILQVSPPDRRDPGSSLYQDVAIEDVLTLLSRLEDPDLVLQKLGLSRWDLRRLETDDEISGALETRREAVMAVPWHLDPYEGANAEWLEDEITRVLDELMRGVWQAVPYGYSVLEVIYKPGARIGIERVSSKPIEWFEPRRDGTLWMTLPSNGIAVEVDHEYKFLLTRRNATYRNPYGEALLSRLYWPWFFRYNGWKFWMRFLERFGDPLLLGQVGDPSKFVEQLTAMGMDAVVGVGTEEKVTAVTTSSEGQFMAVEDALIRRIQRLILGQTASSGDTGGFSKGQLQENVRIDKRNSDVRLVSGTIQRLVDALWTLNGWTTPIPQFVMEDGVGLGEDRATRDATLVNAGILELTEEYLLGNYDFEEGDFIVPEKKEQPATGQKQEQSVAARKRFTADQAEVEELIESTLEQARQPIDPAAILGIIQQATDPDDLVDRLAELYAGHDALEFRELVEQTLFCADVLGYVTAEKRMGQ